MMACGEEQQLVRLRQNGNQLVLSRAYMDDLMLIVGIGETGKISSAACDNGAAMGTYEGET